MIPIPIKVEGAERAESDLRGIERGLDSLSGGAGGVAQGLRGISAEAGIAIAGITALAAAARAAAAVARELGQRLYALGQSGSTVAAVSTAFERLASPQLLGRLRESTRGMVEDIDLMTNATRAMQTGIVSGGQLPEWFELAARSARTMGRDVTEVLRSVTDSLTGRGLEGLQQLGVNAAQIQERVQAMGLSMETTRGQTVAMSMALQQLRDNLASTGQSVSTLGGAWRTLEVDVRNYYGAVAEEFATNQTLIDFFAELRASLESQAPSAREAADALADLAVVLLEASQAGLSVASTITRVAVNLGVLIEVARRWGMAVSTLGFSELGRETSDLERALNAATSTADRMDSVVTAMDGPLENLRRRMSEGSDAIDGQAQSVDTLTSAYARLAEEMDQDALGAALQQSVTDFDPNARGRGIVAQSVAEGHPSNKITRRGGGERDARADEEWRRIVEQNAQFEEALHNQRVKAVDDENTLLERQLELQENIATVRRQAIDDEISAQEVMAQWREQAIADAERQIEVNQAVADALKDQQAQAAERTDQLVSETTSMMGAITGLSKTVVAAVKANAANTEQAAKAEGIFLVAYNSVMAATELAESIRAFYKQDYSSGAGHLIAMAAYISAAALAGSKLGGGSATTPSGGSYKPAERPEAPQRETGDRVQVINLFAVERPTGPLGQQLERATYERERQGYRRAEPPGVRYE